MSIIDLVLALEPNESIAFKKLDFHIEISIRIGLNNMHFFVSIEEMQLNAIPRHIAEIILNNLKVLRQCKKGLQ